VADDFLHLARTAPGGDPACALDAAIFDQCLRALDGLLRGMGSPNTLADLRLPVPAAAPAGALLAEERAAYAPAAQAAERDRRLPTLNPAQRAVYDAVMAVVASARAERRAAANHPLIMRRPPLAGAVAAPPRAFFVDGLGGSGKTYLYGCLLASVRAEAGGVAIGTASSGIAALLLEGGRTAHSRFKIPVAGLSNTSCCYINKRSDLADLIRNADLILWDEAPMMHKHVFEAVDRTLRDLTACLTTPFGGKVFVMGGDFRQVLPVVRRGGRGQTVAAALNQSARLWPHVRVLRLHTNMRVMCLLAAGSAAANAATAMQQDWADYLERVGDGTERTYPEVGEDGILLPPDICCRSESEDALIDEVYGGLAQINDPAARAAFVIERGILTPLNDDVDRLNKK
jgi:hypothetical protein